MHEQTANNQQHTATTAETCIVPTAGPTWHPLKNAHTHKTAYAAHKPQGQGALQGFTFMHTAHGFYYSATKKPWTPQTPHEHEADA